jgi:hypothetical protein
MSIHPISSCYRTILRDSGLILLLSSVLGVGSNLIRPDMIPLIQPTEYEILVPCPETGGDAPAGSVDTSLLSDSNIFLIDARSASMFTEWHQSRAMNVPYDYLEPTNQKIVQQIARSGARGVLVYGDGDDPDSGEQLARELAGKGIRNVNFLKGGAPIMQGQGGGSE